MLPLKNRLKRKKDFERVFEKGKGFRQDFLFLKIVENNKQNSRFAFSVGQKVSKKAVVRNRIKRILREATKARFPNVKPAIDGVMVALPGFSEKEGSTGTKATIEKLFKKAGVYKQ